MVTARDTLRRRSPLPRSDTICSPEALCKRDLIHLPPAHSSYELHQDFLEIPLNRCENLFTQFRCDFAVTAVQEQALIAANTQDICFQGKRISTLKSQ